MTDYLLQLTCVLFLQDLKVKEHNDFFSEWMVWWLFSDV